MGGAATLWIVTGAGGFLGNAIVRALLDRGEQVRACLHDRLGPATLAGLDCERVHLEVTEPDSVHQALRPAAASARTIVVHAAGIVSIADEVDDELYRTNVLGTQHVIDACRDHGIDRLVYISSVHAIPEPAAGPIIEIADFDADAVVGGYARTKAEASRRVLGATDLDRVLLHPTGLIGPGDPGDAPVGRLLRDLAAGRVPAIIGGGNNFVDIRDAAAATIAAAEQGRNGQGYLLAGQQATIRELAELVAELTGARVPPTLPIWAARALAPLVVTLARRRGTRPLFTRYSLHVVRENAPVSSAKARAELGFEPRPLRETIADMLAWYRIATCADARH